MNIKVFVLAGIIGLATPTTAMSKPEANFDTIKLEAEKGQETVEYNNRSEKGENQAEVNFEEINDKLDLWQKTTELEQAQSNCNINQTNTSVGRNSFEGSCDWGF